MKFCPRMTSEDSEPYFHKRRSITTTMQERRQGSGTKLHADLLNLYSFPSSIDDETPPSFPKFAHREISVQHHDLAIQPHL